MASKPAAALPTNASTFKGPYLPGFPRRPRGPPTVNRFLPPPGTPSWSSRRSCVQRHVAAIVHLSNGPSDNGGNHRRQPASEVGPWRGTDRDLAAAAAAAAAVAATNVVTAAAAIDVAGVNGQQCASAMSDFATRHQQALIDNGIDYSLRTTSMASWTAASAGSARQDPAGLAKLASPIGRRSAVALTRGHLAREGGGS